MSTKDGIGRESLLKNVLKKPGAKEVFKRYRLACFECGGMPNEKLVHAAQCHGIDVDMLIREIVKPTRPQR